MEKPIANAEKPKTVLALTTLPNGRITGKVTTDVRSTQDLDKKAWACRFSLILPEEGITPNELFAAQLGNGFVVAMQTTFRALPAEEKARIVTAGVFTRTFAEFMHRSGGLDAASAFGADRTEVKKVLSAAVKRQGATALLTNLATILSALGYPATPDAVAEATGFVQALTPSAPPLPTEK